MTQIGGRRGGELDGRLIRFNWPVQSYGAMGKIMAGGTTPASHAGAAEMAKPSLAHRRNDYQLSIPKLRKRSN